MVLRSQFLSIIGGGSNQEDKLGISGLLGIRENLVPTPEDP